MGLVGDTEALADAQAAEAMGTRYMNKYFSPFNTVTIVFARSHCYEQRICA